MALLGEEIKNSKQINSLIDQLVAEVMKVNQGVEPGKQAQDEHRAFGQQLVQEVGQVRGRDLVYPYVSLGAGKGPYVELADGSVKIDLINGIGINIMGHSHPEVMKACVRGALSDVIVQGNLQPGREYLDYLKKIVGIAGRKSRLKYGWITTSGSMANENALKMARQKKSPAKLVLAMKDAFAGRTTMMAEITDNPAYRQGLPEYHEVLRVPFYDKNDPRSSEKSLATVKELVAHNKNNVAAFMFEPIQGEGGFKVAPREFFLPIFDFCREQNIAIWADEVQTFCRTGEFFAFEKLDIGEYLDLCTIAKTAQVATTLYTEEFNPKPGLVAGTFAGSSAALAAGTAIIEVLETQGYLGPQGKIQQIHNDFIAMLNDLAHGSCKGLLSDPGGMGLMIAVTPYDGSKPKVDALLKELFKNGMVAFSCGHGPYRVRFLIPAVVQKQDILFAKGVIEKSVLALK